MACRLLFLCHIAFANATFHQTHFAIGGGYDPFPSNGSYAAAKDAGLTFLHQTSDKASPQEMAALCVEHNLSCALELGSLKTIAPGPGVWGYDIRDEPRAKDFPTLAADVASVRAVRPDALSFINLLGYGGCENTTEGCARFYGTNTYAEYLDAFVSTVKPDILSTDFYIKDSSPTNLDMWHLNLEYLHNKSVQAGVPFWNYVWMSTNGWGLSQGFYRWQLFTSVAYGSKGLLQWSLSPCRSRHDCSSKSRWSPYPSLFDKYGHTFKPIFDMVQAEHKPFAIFGPLLMQMELLTVVRTKSARPAAVAGMPVVRISGPEGGPWLLGHFKDGSKTNRSVAQTGGQPYDTGAYGDCVMVVNDDPTMSRFASIDLVNASLVREVSATDGALVPLTDDAPDVPGFQLFFLEGAGRLLCWSNTTIPV
jgi:hypothetical protein